MNLFEFVHLAGVAVGLVLGAHFGLGKAGPLGAVLGAAGGAVVGFILAIVPIAILVGPVLIRDRRAERKLLASLFGRYWRKERDGDWQTVTNQLTPSQRVRGKVVAERGCSKYVDIGAGFPAMLHLTRPQLCVGDEVSARVLYLGNAARLVVLDIDADEPGNTETQRDDGERVRPPPKSGG